ncbi:MAG: hypothetical protein HYZ50_13545 [Deltaproteobacteria bacterium]|nr:hypothetical protein [Deltaproteobacteria bacterium]
MRVTKSLTRLRYNQPRATGLIALLVAFLLTLVLPTAWAASEPDPSLSLGRAALEETLGVDSPLGRLSYLSGRGLRVGNTGLTVGGFSTVEAEFLEGGQRRGSLEELNFLISYDPVPFVHLFSELGIGTLAELERGRNGIHSNPHLEVERLYLDLGDRDALRLRFGKFFTPIGRWNLARIEPLLWTTSEPLLVEEVFDDSTTGAMLHGTVFPHGGALSYSLYGAFLDPLDAESDEDPVRHSAGAHVEWASLKGWTLGASYFASQLQKGEWNHLGGADLLWLPHRRVELSGEVVFGEGSREDGVLWGFYAQTVVETVRTLYLVGRYEHFDPPSGGRAVNLFDLGFAWVPVSYFRVKADYLIADHRHELAEPGLRMSFSILF